MSSQDIPRGDAQDNDYVSRPGQKEAGIPVLSDDAPIEDPVDAEVADSDEQLGKDPFLPLIISASAKHQAIENETNHSAARDETEAIDKSNIIEEKTRGAKPTGSYREPGDEEGLPGPEDGTSSV